MSFGGGSNISLQQSELCQNFGQNLNLSAVVDSVVTINTIGYNSIGFQLTIPTGATVVFESSFDGITFGSCTIRGTTNDGYTQSTTASGGFIGSISNTRLFRVRVSIAGILPGTVAGTLSPAINTLEGQENGPPYDLPTAISIGRIAGVTGLRRVGRNPDIDISQETVCNHITSGLAQYSASAETWYVSSTSVSDTFQISVTTLNASYAESTQLVTLSGQSAVALTGVHLRLNRMFNNSDTSAVGDVYIQRNNTVTNGIPTTANNIRGKINIGEEQSSTSQYTVPAGFTFFCEGWQGSVSIGVSTVGLYSRLFGKVFRLRSQQYASTTVSVPFASYTSFPEKTDIEFRASTTANNTGVAIEMYGQVRAN